MSKKPDSPRRFVNLQASNVSVYDERKRVVGIGCFERRFQQSGIFVLEGAHWSRFVTPMGPLSPYPENDEQGFRPEMVRRDKAAQAAVEAGQSPDSFRSEEETAPEGDPEAESGTDETEPVDPGEEGDEGEEEELDETDRSPDADDATGEEDDADEEGASDSDDGGDENVSITLVELRAMTKAQLVELATNNEIDTSGNKATLLERIEAALFTAESDSDEE